MIPLSLAEKVTRVYYAHHLTSCDSALTVSTEREAGSPLRHPAPPDAAQGGSTVNHVIYAALVLAAPDPGSEAPPGSEHFLKLLHWVSWGVSIAGVIGFLAVAGGMMLSHSRGNGGTAGEHGAKFAMVAAGCAVAAASGLIATGLGV
jgi:hypothetical protein